MNIGVYPGSFDPITLGHLDIIKRASRMFDKVIVGILNNSSKQSSLFTLEERKNMIIMATDFLDNIEVRSFNGLSVDFAKECNANCIIRGLRLITDFEYELQMAQTNNLLNKDVETIFLVTNKEYSFISSSTTKDVAFCGGDIRGFVPECILEKIRDKCFKKEYNNEN